MRAVGAKRAAAGLALGLAAATAALSLLGARLPSGAFAGAPTAAPQAVRGEAVTRHAMAWKTQKKEFKFDPFGASTNRERELRKLRESRVEKKKTRGAKIVTPTLNYDVLPSIEDIYTRRFTGNSTIDAIGGRMRYTYYVLFKNDPLALGPEVMKKSILEYMFFFKYKMSCRNIKADSMKNPADGEAIVKLEYPMKQYGEWDVRTGKPRAEYSQAKMVKFEMMSPTGAAEYIGRKFFADPNILRFRKVCHTRTWENVGEDNELLL